MRKQLTPAEAALWEALRKHRLSGMHFRRQHAIGRFVLNFCCPAKKLVIELDGEIHADQRDRDEERTFALEAAGDRVVRFRNEEVLTDMNSVVERISRMVKR